MPANRILLLPLIASVALAGCQIRKADSVAVGEYQNDNTQQAGQIETLKLENSRLSRDLDKANAELTKLRADSSLGAKLNRELKGEAIEGTTLTEGGGLALSEDFAFAKGSADLSEEGKKTIEKIAARLNEGDNAAAKVIVEGHTDDTPVARHSTIEKYGDNWGLSAARSAAVVRALQAHQVDPKRIIGRFRGENAPRVATGDKSEKAKNRRVEIYLD